MAVSLANRPHVPQLVEGLRKLRAGMALSVDERHNCVPRQAADPVPEPFASDEDRRADVKPERVVLEGGPVAIAHQEADQPLVGLVHLLFSTPEAYPYRVHG